MRASLATSSFLLALCACGPAPVAPAELPAERPDKASLYGDASLLPTRAGERAREELALAAQISSALEHLGLEPKQLEVELDPEPRVVAIVERPASADPAEQREAVRELCLALVPRLEPEGLHLWLRTDVDAASTPETCEPTRGPSPWLLALVCLGLGLSLGVTLERGRVLLRLRTR